MCLVEKRMRSVLIGHRGIPDSCPENSIGGFEAALQSGALFIETDVQVTADQVPILSHDPTLKKLTGHDIVITDTVHDDFRMLSAGYPERFGSRFDGYRIATLEELVNLIKRWPEVKVFVELKRESLEKHGSSVVIDILRQSLARIRSQCIVISFEYPALEKIRDAGDFTIGWVIPEWSEQNRKLADLLAPDYLFCNRKRLPEGKNILWPGPWQWVAYTVNDPVGIQHCLGRGFDLVETNCVNQLLKEA